MATYDTSHRLRTYRVRVAWNPAPIDPQRPQTMLVHPQLHATHLKLVDHCSPQPQLMTMQNGATFTIPSDHAQLAQLCILPPAPPVNGTESTKLQVLALFNKVVDHTEILQQGQSSCSIIARWDLTQSDPNLHESFKALKSGTESASPVKVRLKIPCP